MLWVIEFYICNKQDHILNFITSYFVLGTEAEVIQKKNNPYVELTKIINSKKCKQVEELNQKCQELTRRIDYLTNSHGINANV